MKFKVEVVGNIWTCRVELESKGEEWGDHCHYFSHMHLLTEGTIDLYMDGVGTERYTAPATIIVPEEIEHSFVAVSDRSVGYCIHPLRDDEYNLIDPKDLPERMTEDEWIARGTWLPSGDLKDKKET